MNLATTINRVVAYIIDAIIVGLAIAVLVFILDVIDFPQWFQGLVAFVIYYGYFTYMEGTTGQTIGKRLIGTRVVTVDGSPISMGSAAIRNLLRIVDTFFFGLVGLVLIIVTQKKQRVGDMAANTVVIEI